MNPASDITSWGEFGLLGLTLGALFFLFGYLLKSGIQSFSEASKRHHEHMRDVHAEHATERKEWQESLKEVAKDITAAIREMR